MDLKKLMVDTKSVWVDFQGLKGFEVEVANLSRKELTGLRKKCTTTKFDRKTRAAGRLFSVFWKFLTTY